MLLVWERAGAADRAHLQELVRTWKTGSMTGLAALLAKYDTLAASLEIIHQYLAKARHILLEGLPGSNGRSGLLGLGEFLARQTEALGNCA